MEAEKNNHQSGQDGGIGRTHNQGNHGNNSNEKNSGKADISSIDQQEGSMQHGETGGSGHLAPKKDASEGEQKA